MNQHGNQNKKDMIDERERDRYAYEWVGSAPCEDCDRFRECYEADSFSCEERKAWDEKFEKRKRDLMLSL